MIGLGLDDKEITEKGLEAVENADKAYVEFYTNTENIDVGRLEEVTGTEIEKVSRKQVEREDIVLESLKDGFDTAFLVSGDAITATTHFEICKRAESNGFETEVIHGPSIFTSIAETGLSIYKFGRTVTLPEEQVPSSVLDYIEKNDSIGLHTLILLDIGYTADQAANDIIEENPKLSDEEFIVIERANKKDQSIESGSLSDIAKMDLDNPPHSLIKLGEVSHSEEELLDK